MMDRLLREGNPPAGQLASPKPQYKDVHTNNWEELKGEGGASYVKDKDVFAKLEAVLAKLADLESELVTIKANQLSGDQKVQLSGTFVEVTQLVNRYDGVENQHDFVRVPPPRGSGNAILLPEREEYRDYDIAVTNTYDVEFRFVVEYIDSIAANPTILLCNGDLAPFSTSISENAAQIIVPAGVNHLYLSQLPIKRVGDGMEAADPQIWRKFGDKLRFTLRAKDTPSNGGYISVWFVGYK